MRDILEKHKIYKDKYIENDLYWGIGIENEVYLEFENKRKISKDFFMNNHKRERYSVDYFSNYKKEDLDNSFLYIMNNKFINLNVKNNLIEIPLLLNSNSFTKTDSENNSTRMYTKKNEENPKFNGKTLIEELIEKNEYIKNTYEKNWLFDGDTIEFKTNNFYNTKLSNVIDELINSKKEFINNLNQTFEKHNIFKSYGKLKIMEKNHPFSIYNTNLNNISMFNNGTLHYNITLPTELNEYKNIKYKTKFIEDHKKAIKIIQLFEPFLLSVYCSKDFFATLSNYDNKFKFSNSSQRCAVSRYIGIGTYDTDLMEENKILTKKISDLSVSKLDYWWMKLYDSSYNNLEEIGLDINFNKHFNHGIEIRFFDYIIDEKKIIESFEFIIYLMDFILEYDINLENPIKNKIWNNLVLNSIKYGDKYLLNSEEKKIYENLFNIKLNKYNINEIYYEIYEFLTSKFNKLYKLYEKESNEYIFKPIGKFSSLTLDVRIININKIGFKDINKDLEDLELEVLDKNKCCIII